MSYMVKLHNNNTKNVIITWQEWNPICFYSLVSFFLFKLSIYFFIWMTKTKQNQCWAEIKGWIIWHRMTECVECYIGRVFFFFPLYVPKKIKKMCNFKRWKCPKVRTTVLKQIFYWSICNSIPNFTGTIAHQHAVLTFIEIKVREARSRKRRRICMRRFLNIRLGLGT